MFILMASIKQNNSNPGDIPAHVYEVMFIDRKEIRVAFIMNAYFPCEESNFEWVFLDILENLLMAFLQQSLSGLKGCKWV